MGRIGVTLLTLLLVAFAGCGESGPTRGDVQGAVTVGGEPIEEGAIVFTPVEGVEGAPMQYKITDGSYVSSEKGVPIGKNSVYISGVKATGKQSFNFVTGEMSDDFMEIVPAKYNEKTTLEVEVKEGENTFDFELDGKPGRKDDSGTKS